MFLQSLRILSCVFLLLQSIHVYANSAALISVSDIKNMSQVMDTLHTNHVKSVPFPSWVPKLGKPMYAVLSSYDKPNYAEYWMITITTDPTCVAKACVVGSLSASATDKLDLTYLQAPFGPKMTPVQKEKITLSDNRIVYFTPGHAEADWHPPSFEWQQDGMLYHFSWDLGDNAKVTLTHMFNKK